MSLQSDISRHRVQQATTHLLDALERVPELTVGESLQTLGVVLTAVLHEHYDPINRLKKVDLFCDLLHRNTSVRL